MVTRWLYLISLSVRQNCCIIFEMPFEENDEICLTGALVWWSLWLVFKSTAKWASVTQITQLLIDHHHSILLQINTYIAYYCSIISRDKKGTAASQWYWILASLASFCFGLLWLWKHPVQESTDASRFIIIKHWKWLLESVSMLQMKNCSLEVIIESFGFEGSFRGDLVQPVPAVSGYIFNWIKLFRAHSTWPWMFPFSWVLQVYGCQMCWAACGFCPNIVSLCGRNHVCQTFSRDFQIWSNPVREVI